MWSWTEATKGLESEFCSYNKKIHVFQVSNTPYGSEVYARRTLIENEVEYELEKQEMEEYLQVKHEMMLETLETSEEPQTDGTTYLFGIYPRLVPNLDEDIHIRNERSPLDFYAEEQFWIILKKLISFHALLQSKVSFYPGNRHPRCEAPRHLPPQKRRNQNSRLGLRNRDRHVSKLECYVTLRVSSTAKGCDYGHQRYTGCGV